MPVGKPATQRDVLVHRAARPHGHMSFERAFRVAPRPCRAAADTSAAIGNATYRRALQRRRRDTSGSAGGVRGPQQRNLLGEIRSVLREALGQVTGTLALSPKSCIVLLLLGLHTLLLALPLVLPLQGHALVLDFSHLFLQLRLLLRPLPALVGKRLRKACDLGAQSSGGALPMHRPLRLEFLRGVLQTASEHGQLGAEALQLLGLRRTCHRRCDRLLVQVVVVHVEAEIPTIVVLCATAVWYPSNRLGGHVVITRWRLPSGIVQGCLQTRHFSVGHRSAAALLDEALSSFLQFGLGLGELTARHSESLVKALGLRASSGTPRLLLGQLTLGCC
mmetsp:Transcript_122806/g.347136  ORF Transcript_122806/g.347136 Transcript_122806/m.347136 type:complete len:334 (-) Transcript_122806:2456-3457(-)